MFFQIREALVDSFRRVLTKLAIFLPGVLALVLAVAGAALIGGGLAWGAVVLRW